jgi:beta-lactamase class A
MVRGWLSANVDQSMVGSVFVEQEGLDPIAHHASVGGTLDLWNKTGTDAGVRADAGAVTLRGRTLSWAAVANWQPGSAPRDSLVVWSVLRGMRHVGEQVLDGLR